MGSNVDPDVHLCTAARELRRRFPDIRFSHVYRSPAMGMEGADFLNACGLFTTDLSMMDIKVLLRRLERLHGRRQRGWVPRTLDLDIIVYHRYVDWKALALPFVAVPAADLVPSLCKPCVKVELKRIDLRL